MPIFPGPSRRGILGGLVAAPALLKGARRAPGDKPNLLFLWTDEQRADTLAAYGNHRFHVPVLNRLASESVVFDRCYDTQPVCTPARSSVLTGQWPHANGCLNNNIALKRETPCLPELLAEPAYRTAYMGKWHLGDEVFAQHGFTEWISMEDGYDSYFSTDRPRDARSSYHHFLLEQGYKPDSGKGTRFSRDFAVRRKPEHCKPAFLAREASRFIRQTAAEPWLLHVNFLEPHMPFFGPYNDLHTAEETPVPANYPGDQVEREPERYRRTRSAQLARGTEGHDLKTREGWQRLNRNYAGLCTQVDEAVGRILWTLEATGQAENTIIVFTSDHGEMMGSHSLFGKSVMYEEAVRVPLLLRVPFRKQRPMLVRQPVSHISLVPTLLELLGRKPPENLPGRSLLPLIENRHQRQEDVFIEWHTPPDGPAERTIVTPDGWKLVLSDKDNSLLFNRLKDPLELRNLYYDSSHAQTVRSLRSRIAAWQARVGDSMALPEPAG